MPSVLLMGVASACSRVDHAGGEFRAADRPAAAPTPYQVAERHIDAIDARRHISFLAADARQGRATPSAGLERAAAWIATEFQRAGLEPAADDGGYLQYWPFEDGRPGAPGSERGQLVPNVIGRLPGGPAGGTRGAAEYVVLVAHYDHLGVEHRETGDDSVYNGADDNASGIAALVEVAQAMAALGTPLSRPVLFLAVSGSEAGLLGSTWFATHPTVELEGAVAVLNLDMIGRNHPDSIGVVGPTSGLGPTIDRIAAATPALSLTVAPDPAGSDRLRPSDHMVFAERGVPAIRFFSGLHDDYHTPADEVDRIDPDKVARVARLVFLTAHHLATADP